MAPDRVRGCGIVLSNFGKPYSLVKCSFKRKHEVEQRVGLSLDVERGPQEWNLEEMQSNIMEELRRAKIGGRLLPFLADEGVHCRDTCECRACFEGKMIDSCADLLLKCCESVGNKREILIRSVQHDANILWDKNDRLNRHWQTCCQLLK